MEMIPTSQIFNEVYDKNKKKLKVDAELEVQDIQIGAVEIKDKDSDARAIVGKGALYTSPQNEATGKIVIWIDNNTSYQIYNPSLSFSYDDNNNLTEIQISGVNNNGDAITLKRTFSYDNNGNLTSVSKWQVV